MTTVGSISKVLIKGFKTIGKNLDMLIIYVLLIASLLMSLGLDIIGEIG